MKKFAKIMAAALLAVVTVFGIGAVAACTADETEYTFTFTVVYEDGTAASNVGVVICNLADGICAAPVKTDADGKVEITKEKGSYSAHIIAPDGYLSEEGTVGVEVGAEKREYTFTLKADASASE